MIEKSDFVKKQMLFYFPSQGDRMTFRNDNLVIRNREQKIKIQVTCYRIFLIFVIGDTSITTGLLNRANKFGFSICLMNRNMKVYKFISARMEGNTFLRKRQYEQEGTELAQYIVYNKIQNQRTALVKLRKKTELTKEAIQILDGYLEKLQQKNMELNTLLGIEGSAARVYFPQMFNMVNWKGRKPRIKSDYINATLDIGYTIVFNIVDALLNCYGFDEYYGVLHRCFYMRKSLVCDLMEPLRPVIDYTIRKAINRKQIQESDFKIYNKRYVLEWSKSADYARLFLEAVSEYKEELFMYIQGYYRAFMKQKDIKEYPLLNYKG